MSEKAYRQKTEAKLEELESTLKDARAKAKGAAADVRIEAEKHIEILQAKVDEAKKQLATMGDAAEETLRGIVKGLDEARSGISEGVKNFFSK
jgi:archaellum component FlaC